MRAILATALARGIGGICPAKRLSGTSALCIRCAYAKGVKERIGMNKIVALFLVLSAGMALANPTDPSPVAGTSEVWMDRWGSPRPFRPTARGTTLLSYSFLFAPLHLLRKRT